MVKRVSIVFWETVWKIWETVHNIYPDGSESRLCGGQTHFNWTKYNHDENL